MEVLLSSRCEAGWQPGNHTLAIVERGDKPFERPVPMH